MNIELHPNTPLSYNDKPLSGQVRSSVCINRIIKMVIDSLTGSSDEHAGIRLCCSNIIKQALHSGKPATIRESNNASDVYKEHYA